MVSEEVFQLPVSDRSQRGRVKTRSAVQVPPLFGALSSINLAASLAMFVMLMGYGIIAVPTGI